jgi:hypothetical protein
MSAISGSQAIPAHRFSNILQGECRMSKMMILGVKGETGLWLVDFASGTVTAVDGNREDYIAAAEGADKSARNCTDIAVAFEPKESAFSGQFYKTPQLDVAVAFATQETAFSGLYYKTPQIGLDAR